MNSMTSASFAALVALGLAGCADTMAGESQSHDTMSMMQDGHKMNEMIWISDADGENKKFEIKIIPEDGSEPIFFSTSDPDSPEFKEAIKKLEASGVQIDLDADHNFKFESLAKLEGLDLSRLEDLDVLVEFKGLNLTELKELAEIKELDGDHKVFIRKMDGFHKVMELKGDHSEWMSEDGKLHIIKKVGEDGTFIMRDGVHDGEHKTIHIEISEDGKKTVEKKVFIMKQTEAENEPEESEDEDDLK